jgi:hypothetical protein
MFLFMADLHVEIAGLASGARPAMPENKSAVNAINRKKLYTTRRNLEVTNFETIQIVE